MAPLNPTSVSNQIIVDEFQTALDGKQFLLYDSYTENSINSILMKCIITFITLKHRPWTSSHVSLTHCSVPPSPRNYSLWQSPHLGKGVSAPLVGVS